MRVDRLIRVLKILLIIAMAATVAFIFVNSMLPPKQSEEHSDTIKDVIVDILPDGSEAEDFVEKYIRKIAHFTEYGLLGIEVALYAVLLDKKRRPFMPLALLLPVFIGFVDESIQILSERGPSIEDVWIDVGGFAVFYLLTLTVIGAVLLTVKVIEKHRAYKHAGKND